MEREFRNTKGTLEIRASVDGSRPRLRGRAVVFNSDSTLLFSSKRGEYIERIAPASPQDIIINDVRAVYDHEQNRILARYRSNRTSNTLSLTIGKEGIDYEFDLPDTQLGKDVAEMVNRGDVDGSSFGLFIRDDNWQVLDGKTYRFITRFEIFDVSPTPDPAYPATSVSALRSLEKWEQEQKESEQETAEGEKENPILIELMKAKQQLLEWSCLE